MADIIKINTDSMKQYAARLAQVNARVVRLNFRIKALYGRVGLIGLYNLIRADQLIHFNWNNWREIILYRRQMNLIRLRQV